MTNLKDTAARIDHGCLELWQLAVDSNLHSVAYLLSAARLETRQIEAAEAAAARNIKWSGEERRKQR